MNNLKAIDTKYKGYNFRSRLEARWAVFFDALNIEWQYEQEGYDLDGLWYLPDFYLPGFDGGTYVEVKPQKLNEQEVYKCEKLVTLSKKNVWFAVGVPDTRQYIVLHWVEKEKDFFCYPGIPLIEQAEAENRMYSWPMDICNSNGFIKERQPFFFRTVAASELYPHLYKAVEAAKSARF